MRNLAPGGENLSVLMLEDNPLDSELVEGKLRHAGYVFTAWKATSRREFENLYATRPYDLVLADYSLPDFDGLCALDMVRSRDKNVPFIFVSGLLGEEVAIESLHRGATDYVLKQRLERLAPAVLRALNEYAERLSRLEAESLLRESERRFQQLTNALPAMVWTTDDQGKLAYCNDVWKEYFDAKMPESWCDMSVVHVDDASQARRQWHDALLSGASLECDCRFRRADGTYRWHLVRFVPVRSGDPHSTWVGTCTDIHAQRQREEMLRTSEKLVVVGRMAGSIAHEINNPLESLTNLLFLLRDSDTCSDPGKSFLDEAEQQLARISGITKQTLSFYRDRAALGHIDCKTLINETMTVFRPKLRQKDIHFNVWVEESCHLQARTGEVRQVLINLVSNAIDAMKVHGRLSIRARRQHENECDFVEFQVEDSGSGIAPEVRSRLFEPFFSTKGTLGTGLGLWVTRNIVDRHKGRIEVESDPGRTMISVLLPVEFCGEQDESEQSAQPKSEQLAS